MNPIWKYQDWPLCTSTQNEITIISVPDMETVDHSPEQRKRSTYYGQQALIAIAVNAIQSCFAHERRLSKT